MNKELRQDDVAKRFAGAWRLVLVEGTDATFNFANDHPTGLIIYDRSGWMSVQIDTKGTRKPLADDPPAALPTKRCTPSIITSRTTAPIRWS
jgi:hypothetical protein